MKIKSILFFLSIILLPTSQTFAEGQLHQDNCDPARQWVVVLKGDSSLGSKKRPGRFSFFTHWNNGGGTTINPDKHFTVSKDKEDVFCATPNSTVAGFGIMVTKLDKQNINCSLHTRPATPGKHVIILKKTDENRLICYQAS